MKINIKFRYGFGSTETAFNFRIKFHCTLTAMKRQINLVLVFVFCKEIQEKKKKKHHKYNEMRPKQNLSVLPYDHIWSFLKRVVLCVQVQN